ncbi:MAG: hypothetical protein B7X55_00565 [Rhodobacterales bacterium 34-62-10]|nr:MAG: hypothetical protein B7X55_00565 [Rhodobacterales bacterium 34-62-10]
MQDGLASGRPGEGGADLFLRGARAEPDEVGQIATVAKRMGNAGEIEHAGLRIAHGKSSEIMQGRVVAGTGSPGVPRMILAHW